jgi:general secretion pathway protein A
VPFQPLDPLMYQAYYGLKAMPFNITPDPAFLYLSDGHREALQHLRYGIDQEKGFIVLTGEVGSGKTTLCRYLLAEIEPKPIETALILNPAVSETQLLQAILRELGLDSPKRARQDCLNQLNEHLLALNTAGRKCLLIVDESQNMSHEALENLRLLSNLETNRSKLLQIILIGQPELKDKLQDPSLRQLRQRILVHYDLEPLNREEMEHYISYRLTVAGANGRPSFTTNALRKIYHSSQGIPRIINHLCDKALLSAYARSRDTANWWDARRAIQDMQRL